MKLQELAVANPTKQAAKVFESYFGKAISVERLTHQQARTMLSNVRKLVNEHRRTPEFHRSEQNPAYLKLVMLEQALTSRIMEVDPAPGTPAAGMDAADASKAKALQAVQIQQKKKQIQDAIKAKQEEIRDLQAQMNNPTLAMTESQLRRLSESEVQQAQVVLASQDMVDQVQKMIEQVTAMQFKDLPALVDQIKNQVGVDQSVQFNTDANTALGGLVQNLQGSKQQLEQALGVVTGQAPAVPGEEAVAPTPAEPAPELPPEENVDIDAEMDANIEPAATALGRGRR
jgi:DNA anti-recombination protein RmuC